MIDFEDAKVRVRIAVCEGVEASAERDILSDFGSDGLRERVFGVTAAGDQP